MNAPVHGRTRLGILLSLTIAAVFFMALPGAASAAIGDITGMSCISKTGTDGCSQLPLPNILLDGNSVAVAPDGSDVYVGAAAGVAHFRRAPNGTLTYASCVETQGVADCPGVAPGDGANALASNTIQIEISPDGRFIYAASNAASLAWWSRDTTSGVLTWGGCIDGAVNSNVNGRCGTGMTFASGNFPAGSMETPSGLAITPDGGSLYIADQAQGLLQAQLDVTTGVPDPQECFMNTGSEAADCTAVAADVPMDAGAIDIAPNNRDIYIKSFSPGGITHFQRSLGLYTLFTSCIIVGGPWGSCAAGAPSPTLLNPGELAVNGNHVITHSGANGVPDGTVSKFARASNGSLSFGNCLTTVAAAGPCGPLPPGTLGADSGKLLISPDGASFYTKQIGNPGALVRFTTDLSFASCIGLGVAACSAPGLPVPFGSGVTGAAFSPDGKQIYQVGSHKLITYTIERPAAVEPPATPTAAKPRIRSIRKMRKGRQRGKYQVKITVAQAGAISTRFEGRLKRGAKIRGLSKLAKRNATRAATYTLYVKPSKTALKRKLKVSLVVTLAPPGYVAAKAAKSVRLR